MNSQLPSNPAGFVTFFTRAAASSAVFVNDAVPLHASPLTSTWTLFGFGLQSGAASSNT